MTFGEKMLALMATRGWSLRRLARETFYDLGHLSRVSRDLKPPSEALARDLDMALRAGGELMALRAKKDVRAPDRWAGVGFGEVTPASEIGHHGPVAPELVDYFRQQLPGHYRADMWLGPHMLIPTVEAQTCLLQRLTSAAEPSVRRGLLELGVAYASLLGWLYQDAADLTHSNQWRSTALDMAHRSGDSQLVSYALSNKAMHAVDRGEGAVVIDYAQAALAEEPRLAPKVRILALVHLAHGYALTGDRKSADRAFDMAEVLIDQIDDDYPWANACRRTPRYMDIQRATAYGRTGHFVEASEVWDRILGDQPEGFRRDTGVFWARQAAALAGSHVPEPEKVVRIASIAVTTCQETGSARLRQEIAAIPAHASAWTDSLHGRELAEIIATVT